MQIKATHRARCTLCGLDLGYHETQGDARSAYAHHVATDPGHPKLPRPAVKGDGG